MKPSGNTWTVLFVGRSCSSCSCKLVIYGVPERTAIQAADAMRFTESGRQSVLELDTFMSMDRGRR
jgi:hypothetical protein